MNESCWNDGVDENINVADGDLCHSNGCLLPDAIKHTQSNDSFVLIPTTKFSVLDKFNPSPIFKEDEIIIIPSPFTDLTEFLTPGALEELGIYLASQSLFTATGNVNEGKFKMTNFDAAGRKHADSIELTDRGGYGSEKQWPNSYDFHDCRINRGSSEYWRYNSNATLLPGLVNFIQKLPFFEQTGKITIILSTAGSRGVEHVDHKFNDFVSEFIWLRTGNGATKPLYIRDYSGEKRYVEKDVKLFLPLILPITPPNIPTLITPTPENRILIDTSEIPTTSTILTDISNNSININHDTNNNQMHLPIISPIEILFNEILKVNPKPDVISTNSISSPSFTSSAPVIIPVPIPVPDVTPCPLPLPASVSTAVCIWFDDHHSHCTDTITSPSYSIRIDGSFTPAFRTYLTDVGIFTDPSFRNVLRGQKASILSSNAAQASKTAIDAALVAITV